MWRLIAQGLLRRRWQSFAALFGVALGSALLVAAFLLYYGLKEGLERGRQRLGADLLVVPANAPVDANEALFAGSPLNIYMDKKYAETARKVPGVRRVEAQFFTQSLQLECCSTGAAIRLIGVEPDAIRRLSALSTTAVVVLQPDEVIIGARTLGGTGRPGTLIELMGDIYRVAYRLETTGTGLDYSILMPIRSAQNLAANASLLKTSWKESKKPDQLYSALLVEVDDPSKMDDVVSALQDLGPLKIIRAGETFQRVKRMISAFIIVLAGAGVLTAVGGLIYLFGQFASTAWDRKGEWALYRALGATQQRLVQLVVGEALALSFGGVLIGFPLGLILYEVSLQELSAQNAFPFVPPSLWLLIVGAFGVFIIYMSGGLLAAVLPAIRVTQLEPASIMAQGDID